jgi:flavin reductase (DIM6/NTAB) family NADH-FMN oxidoreductase RutF
MLRELVSTSRNVEAMEVPVTATSLVDADLFRTPCAVEAGDHSIVLAAPEEGRHHEDLSATPLVHHDGHYANIQGAS